MLKIIIDNREMELKKAFPQSKTIQYENLPIGDIKVMYDNRLYLLIERKTLTDLIASIGDGRYREQKIRIQSQNISPHRVIYLLEGDINTINHTNANIKLYYGMVINTMLRDKYHVFRTLSINETIHFISRLESKLLSEPSKIIGDLYLHKNNLENNNLENNNLENNNLENNNLENNNLENNNLENNNLENNSLENSNLEKSDIEQRYLESIKLRKKDNMTPRMCSILQLSQIPGCSRKVATIIIEKYKTIVNLINQVSQEEKDINKINMLSELKMTIENNKERKIGKVLSKRILEYLGIIFE